MNAADQVWTITDRSAISARVWDDGMVVYDARRDEVRCFDDLTAEVFIELRSAPRRVSELVSALSNRLEVAPDAELEALVREILDNLDSSQLAVPLA